MKTNLLDIRRSEFKVLRVDGSIVLYVEKPTLDKVYQAIGCTCCDTVILDHENAIVMLVDDTGMIDGKPVNPRATVLYHSICYPGTAWKIHGDVAIVNDRDFA